MAVAFGGPESLSVEEVTLPDPGPHEVHVQVRAAGVNPADVKAYRGPGDPPRSPSCSATRPPAWLSPWVRARPTTKGRSPSVTR